ncbi:phosphoesterase, MJ0936 family [Frankia torreyi]|uniref:Phosphoesterase n=1 Tax=Frankia torreyi TaxID=1856 RepID=A0A0D8BAZ7_9ACTN|nr:MULTISPECIES: metallophosphoesterase [Frankia]KJE20557.1 phosphoesterase, MJ0936 family [Frankia torreyi]KQM02878.1 phosphoesterase, MJ0936 family [Frankia sp. CpI1-P]
MRLVMLSDTHLPARARALPAEIWTAIAEADVVLHAGDWISRDAVDELAARAGRLIGCYGNNDGPDVRAVLPEVARATLGGLRFVVVHETGPARGRERRMAAAYPEADVLVFGHSHVPWDSTVARAAGPASAAGPAARTPSAAPSTLRLLNPGSPTDRRRQPAATYLTAVVARGRPDDVVLHPLPTAG